MTVGQATYTFLPWFRRGVSTGIERVDGSASEGPRALFPVTLVLKVGPKSKEATAKLALHGPGEVAGIDQRNVIRTDPPQNVFDTESNYFPMIEFDQPDFPWRYTPAKATTEDRLRPWIALIVLADGEIDIPPKQLPGQLPSITVSDLGLLPDLSQSWAWAHVQITGLDPASVANPEEEIARIEREEPHRTVSRLLCVRRLKPRTAYTAYLVPTFERGRRAGLNQEISDTKDSFVDALLPAWQSSDPSVDLPVYYQWRFQTADVGNFESLVRDLKPRVLSATVGRRSMDASAPGAGLSAAARADGAPLTMEGALMSPACRDSIPEWTTRQPFVGQLEQLVNTPAAVLASGAGFPVVAPPLYGRWHVSRNTLQAASAPSWFDELNADPQLRAVAGLGTRVVQEQQEQLMAAAWDQVEGILAANKHIRQAELASAVAGRLVERDLLKLTPATAIEITAPILGQVFASPRTILATLQDSPIAGGALQAQFRQLTRPLGPIGRRQARSAKRLNDKISPNEPLERTRFGLLVRKSGTVLERMNRGKLPLEPPAAGKRLPSIKRIAARLEASRSAWWRYLPAALAVLALLLLGFAILIPLFAIAVIFAALGVLSAGGAWKAHNVELRWTVIARLRAGTLSAKDVLRARPAPGFRPRESAFDTAADAAKFTDAEAVSNFQTAFAKMAERLTPAQAAPASKPSANFEHLHKRIMESIDPAKTIPAGLTARLKRLPPGATRDPATCSPMMMAPIFDQPMYEPLRDLSQEWLLPGVGDIPPDTVSLLVTNQRFVESYMLGLNYEMGRELLWREYPTDQRGTYFRQFWDVRGYAGPAGSELTDIAPIDKWDKATRLGTHRRAADSAAPTASAAPAPGSELPAGDHLVLLIRGRLLQRYPNTVIYAIRATLHGSIPVVQGAKRDLLIEESEQRHPLFFGTLQPDIAFVGFDLTRDEVMGNDQSTAAKDQGWFFVFQEHPSAPRFGLNVPLGAHPHDVTWAELSWGHLVSDETELDQLTYINLDPDAPYPGGRPLPMTPTTAATGEPQLAWHASAGSRSSDLAYITLRKPFRVAIHGSDMLPSP